MRVYCGLASAGERLTAAVIDDFGQVAALHQVTDDPQGYAELLGLLCRRADTSGVMCVPFASDSPGRPVLQLLLAAGRTMCFVDDATVARLAAAEPPNAAADARHAVAMARALYSGQLTAAAQPSPPQLASLRPALCAHTGLTVSRTTAVAALREVLRQLYPAALRAFPDPGAPTPLAVLDAMPDPGKLNHGDSESVVARLTTAGFADAAAAIDELRRAVGDDAARPPTPSVSATVRQTVAAVLACDTAVGVLLRDIGEQLGHAETAPAPAPTPAAEQGEAGGWALAVAPEPATPGHAGPTTTAPLKEVANPGRYAPQGAGSPDRPFLPAAEASAATEAAAGRGKAGPPAPSRASRRRGRSPQPADTSSTVPLRADDPTIRLRRQPADDSTAEQPMPAAGRYAPQGADSPEQPFLPGESAPLAGTAAEPSPAADPALSLSAAVPERPVLPGEPDPPQLDFSTDFQPTVIMGDDDPGPQSSRADGGRGFGPADRDNPTLRNLGPVPRPPVLRSVGSGDEPSDRDPLGSVTPLPEPSPRSRRDPGARSRRRNRSNGHDLPRPERHVEPVDLPGDPIGDTGDESDSELLIFAAARSAWFAGEHGELEWDSLADEGWRAAEAASRPAVGDSTESGLPRRVPQANLVPGSPVADEPTERGPITRDASQLAAQTAGYFRGWQRGRRQAGHDPAAFRSEAFTPAGRR